MQFSDRLESYIVAILQDRKKLVILGGGMVVVLGIVLLAGIFFAGPTNAPAAIDSTGKPGSTASITQAPEGFSFGSKKNSVPTLAPTRTPEENAYLSAIPPTPTDIPFVTKKDLDEFTDHPSPTPTPLPGTFYIPNGQQNDLQIMYVHQNTGDSFDEIHLRNNKTTEERLIGYIYHYTPGDPAFFSRDFSHVYFTGGSKNNYNQISIYSIAQDSITQAITLSDMKKALPQLKLDDSYIVTMLSASPDKSKLAISYGNTFSTNRIAPKTQIIVINTSTGKMQLLPVYGLVHGWKDDTTLQYDTFTSDPNVNTTQEIAISGI
jgi:hypothetical protein